MYPGLIVVRRFTREDYEKAISDLQDGMTQLEPDGACCAVCGDGGHQAWECHHNPLVRANNFEADQTRWRCFHCGEVFTTFEEAGNHFGHSEQEFPVCLPDVENLLETLQGMTEVAEETSDPKIKDYVAKFAQPSLDKLRHFEQCHMTAR